jgi:hypothetical protein
MSKPAIDPKTDQRCSTRNLFDRIKALKAEGYGYEDIALKLDLNWRDVRQFVITRGEK